MPTPKFYHVHTDLGIPKVAEIKEKEDLQIMLKWGNYFLIRLNFTHLKNKYLFIHIQQ